ncbi:MAG TPA: hypothetical protein VGB71_04525 [Flavisolibacter sp.]
MTNDRENNPQQQPGTGSAENLDRDRKEQFNELSELSLEERMAVADQIGVPVDSVIDIASTGAMSGRDDAAGGSNDQMEEQSTGQETDR